MTAFRDITSLQPARQVNAGVSFIMKKRIDIPSGLAHLEMVANLADANRVESMKHFAESSADCRMIGTSLSALYQAATCHRECHGGPHILESLCGRIYDLAVGAYLLAERGLYDEALNLIRSIGEASNLIALSVVDKEALKEWLASDKKTRLRKFRPSEVRKALERQERTLLLADEDWYSRFCETYTHVTPQTRPNVHNPGGQSHVGGVYQSEGLKRTLEELATVLGSVSMLVCKYFNFSDLFEEICAVAKSANGEAAKSRS
jgi:hypothetical protein